VLLDPMKLGGLLETFVFHLQSLFWIAEDGFAALQL